MTAYFETTQGILATGVAIGALAVMVGFWSALLVLRTKAGRRNAASRTAAAKHLAMRTVLALDDFVGGCYAAAHDQPEFNPADPSDFLFHVEDPRLALPQDADWTLLKADLVDDIIWLPNRLRNVMDALESIELRPPHFNDYFEHRQEDFSRLGLRAMDLIDRLCTVYGLKKPERPAYYRPREGLQAKAVEIASIWKRRRMALKRTAPESNVTPLFPLAAEETKSRAPDADPQA